MKMLNKILEQLKKYLEWETEFDFSGYQDIEIYIGETLSEAWIKARPNDEYKFTDLKFKNYVDNASGKWLEKQFPEDKYKVILSLEYSDDPVVLAGILVHELRHCLDYSKAVSKLTFDKYTPGNEFYCNWSEFRSMIVRFRYQFFQEIKAKNNNYFKVISELLGYWSADSMEGLLTAENKQEELYFLSRYIGVARAARNLNMENDNVASFHLWHLMPLTIYEKYDCVFYIANEWEKISVCQLNQAETTYYRDLVNRIENETNPGLLE